MKFSEYQASKKNWKTGGDSNAHKAEPKPEHKRGGDKESHAPAERPHGDPDTERIERTLQLSGRIHSDHLERVPHPPRLRVQHSVSHNQMEYLLGEKIRDEELLSKPHRHHWTYLVLRAFVPFLFSSLFLGLFWFGLVSGTALLALVMILPLAIAGFFLFYYVYDWMNDYLVVTNYRFMRVRRDRFIDNYREQLPVERAEESRITKANNPVQWIFSIGHITIPGAGARSGNALGFRWIKHPEEVQKVVENARKASRNRVTQERERNIIRYTANKRDNKPTDIMPPNMHRMHPVVQGSSLFQSIVPVRPEVPAGANNDYRIILHKHWFVLVQKAGAQALFFFLDVTVGLWFVLQIWSLNLLNLSFIGPLMLVLWVISAAILGFVLWYRWEDWRNDLYIITNTRVIDVERKPFNFSVDRAVVPFGKVQKSERTRRSPIELFFNFGNVEVFSASGEKALDFMNVPNPEEVEEEITYRTELAKEREQTLQDQRIADFFAIAARERLFWPDEQPPPPQPRH